MSDTFKPLKQQVAEAIARIPADELDEAKEWAEEYLRQLNERMGINHPEPVAKEKVRPRFVKLAGTALQQNGPASYFRPAGKWSIGSKFDENGVLRAVGAGHLAHATGWPLIECTEEEFKEDNEGYV